MGTALSVGTGRHLAVDGRAMRCLESGDELTFRVPVPNLPSRSKGITCHGCRVWLSQFLSTECGKCCSLEPRQEGVVSLCMKDPGC